MPKGGASRQRDRPRRKRTGFARSGELRSAGQASPDMDGIGALGPRGVPCRDGLRPLANYLGLT